jgi:phospholipid/cholesterol/gamma-HCH transport system substrate-binding protein
MNKVNSGEGTLGKLLTDDKIYQRLNSATLAADTLFNDFQERPYRYVPFKSRKRVLKHDRKDEALREKEAGN